MMIEIMLERITVRLDDYSTGRREKIATTSKAIAYFGGIQAERTFDAMFASICSIQKILCARRGCALCAAPS